MCTRVCVCLFVFVCTFVFVCLCVCVYICVCLCVYFIIQQEVLDIARDLLEEIQVNPSKFGDHTEFERKLKQTKAVLEMYVNNPPILLHCYQPRLNRYGYFSGINRKVQFKSIRPPDPTHGK